MIKRKRRAVNKAPDDVADDIVQMKRERRDETDGPITPLMSITGCRQSALCRAFRRQTSSADPLNIRDLRPLDPNEKSHNELADPESHVGSVNAHDPLNLGSLTGVNGRRKRRKRSRVLEPKSEDDAHGENSLPIDSSPRSKYSRDSPLKPPSSSTQGLTGIKLDAQEEAVNEPNEGKGAESSSDAAAMSSDERLPNKQESLSLDRGALLRSGLKDTKQERYKYGNFNNYYQHLHRPSPSSRDLLPQMRLDPRVEIFCRDWFLGKVVLDVGCNSGIFSLSLAKVCRPQLVVGVDIDGHLIGAARKNLRLVSDYANKLDQCFPKSFGVNFGPISTPSTSSSSTSFPHNVHFRQENCVPENEEALKKVKHGRFDSILALSVIPYIHLNWGDIGLKRFFRWCFLELKAGGRFIVEVDSFSWYRRKYRKLPDRLKRVFTSLKLFPDAFSSYLLSNEVGFTHQEELDTNTHMAREMGWSDGRLLVFYRGEFMVTNEAMTS